MNEVTQPKNSGNLWDWFGLSYASFLVIPRVLMHEMPAEWQDKMAALLHEYDETFDTSSVVDSVSVVGKGRDNKFTKLPDYILNYRHPDREEIEKLKR
ncbi:hypothetical protein AB6F62_20230 [Providencia huaxiensis]|uniref:hypothetical protein n=1 Tax=Providencia huaxiensis TaxID=2027290 RepID=UPI0024ABEC7D|nr:hypothetical protein [Providencia rettgeri]ELR5210127.1 hypothetical protein [Providencia rettgeri]ELR5249025.1 hypothetical protein [Providencia rettgeri]HEM8137437.1 hypothetical protein [Providencia rettgeri]